MLPIERLEKIQDMLKVQKILKVEDLSKIFNVSDMTIRRDFEKLEQQGFAKRCYGGITQRTDIEFDRGFRERRVLRTDVKQALAQYCYDHFIDGTEIIYLDAGSTILYLAKLLAAKHPPNLTVITNDVIIAAELVNTDIHLIILGGQVQNSLGCIHGYIAESQIAELRMDSAFVSGLAVDSNYDLFAATEPKVYFRKRLLEQCNSAYLVIDSSKMGRQSIFRTHNLSEYTAVISDKTISEQENALLKNRGIHWIVPPKEEETVSEE